MSQWWRLGEIPCISIPEMHGLIQWISGAEKGEEKKIKQKKRDRKKEKLEQEVKKE